MRLIGERQIDCSGPSYLLRFMMVVLVPVDTHIKHDLAYLVGYQSVNMAPHSLNNFKTYMCADAEGSCCPYDGIKVTL